MTDIEAEHICAWRQVGEFEHSPFVGLHWPLECSRHETGQFSGDCVDVYTSKWTARPIDDRAERAGHLRDGYTRLAATARVFDLELALEITRREAEPRA